MAPSSKRSKRKTKSNSRQPNHVQSKEKFLNWFSTLGIDEGALEYEQRKAAATETKRQSSTRRLSDKLDQVIDNSGSRRKSSLHSQLSPLKSPEFNSLKPNSKVYHDMDSVALPRVANLPNIAAQRTRKQREEEEDSVHKSTPLPPSERKKHRKIATDLPIPQLSWIDGANGSKYQYDTTNTSCSTATTPTLTNIEASPRLRIIPRSETRRILLPGNFFIEHLVRVCNGESHSSCNESNTARDSQGNSTVARSTYKKMLNFSGFNQQTASTTKTNHDQLFTPVSIIFRDRDQLVPGQDPMITCVEPIVRSRNQMDLENHKESSSVVACQHIVSEFASKKHFERKIDSIVELLCDSVNPNHRGNKYVVPLAVMKRVCIHSYREDGSKRDHTIQGDSISTEQIFLFTKAQVRAAVESASLSAASNHAHESKFTGSVQNDDDPSAEKSDSITGKLKKESPVVIQKYIKPRGTRPWVLRFEWNENKPSVVWIVSSSEQFHKSCTLEGFVGSITELPVLSVATSLHEDSTSASDRTRGCTVTKALASNGWPEAEAVVNQFTNNLNTDLLLREAGVRCVSLLSELIHDEMGRWWITQVKGFHVARINCTADQTKDRRVNEPKDTRPHVRKVPADWPSFLSNQTCPGSYCSRNESASPGNPAVEHVVQQRERQKGKARKKQKRKVVLKTILVNKCVLRGCVEHKDHTLCIPSRQVKNMFDLVTVCENCFVAYSRIEQEAARMAQQQRRNRAKRLRQSKKASAIAAELKRSDEKMPNADIKTTTASPTTEQKNLLTPLERKFLAKYGESKVLNASKGVNLNEIDPITSTNTRLPRKRLGKRRKNKGKKPVEAGSPSNQDASELLENLEAIGGAYDVSQVDIVSCIVGCGKLVLRSEQEIHATTECPKRLVECPYCSIMQPLDDLEWHKEHSCEGALVAKERAANTELNQVQRFQDITCKTVFSGGPEKKRLCGSISHALKTGSQVVLEAPIDMNNCSLEECRLVLRSLYLEFRGLCVDQGYFPNVPVDGSAAVMTLVPIKDGIDLE